MDIWTAKNKIEEFFNDVISPKVLFTYGKIRKFWISCPFTPKTATNVVVSILLLLVFLFFITVLSSVFQKMQKLSMMTKNIQCSTAYTELKKSDPNDARLLLLQKKCNEYQQQFDQYLKDEQDKRLADLLDD